MALVSGGARGQGRAHALALAREGADVAVCDICQPIPTVPYPLATEEDLEQTRREIVTLGRKALAQVVDVRRPGQMEQAVAATLDEFRRLDILVANAGIISYGRAWELTDEQWQAAIDVDLTGVWHSCKAVIPHMIAQRYGKIVCTSSVYGLQGGSNLAHYVAAKHGVIGLVRALAIDLAEYGINVNAICPTSMDTPIVNNQATYDLFAGGPNGTRENLIRIMNQMNLFPDRDLIDPQYAAEAVVWLVSDAARHITGHALPIDAGFLLR